MARTRLPDGTSIDCIVRTEARVLVEHSEGYLEEGIELPEGAVVLDVGANVGVFSVMLTRSRPDVLVHAFEPIPPIAAVLQKNADRLGDGRITVHAYGVGLENAEFEFMYFPRCPALSSAHMDLWDNTPGAFKEAVRGHIEEAGKYIFAARLVPSFLAGPISKFLQGGAKRYKCEIRPLSEVFLKHDLAKVDLLKVDCEGAELAVLQGIEDAYWPRIQQVVAEVMDVDGRLEICRQLLSEKGFQEITVARESGLENTPMYNVYARRINAS